MSATDELRRLLDERGVEWMPIAWNPKRETFYHAANGVGFCADEYTDGVKIYTDATITPEQAIEATLVPLTERAAKDSEKDIDGRGECRNTEQLPLAWSFTCSECGVHSITEGERFNFCPNCGGKVVDG